ncbi:MAG: hypothetical protein ACJAQ6_001846 [Arenicella sp.]|jgi:hypothetical protein
MSTHAMASRQWSESGLERLSIEKNVRLRGLESNRTVLLSLAVIFMVLVYFYPLRMIFDGMFASISNDYFTSDLKLRTYAEVRRMFLFYSIGSGVMALLICDLYRNALINKAALGLSQDEIFETKLDITCWFIIAIFSLISIAIALTVRGGLLALAGYVYFLMFAALPLASQIQRARRKNQSS